MFSNGHIQGTTRVRSWVQIKNFYISIWPLPWFAEDTLSVFPRSLIKDKGRKSRLFSLSSFVIPVYCNYREGK